MIRVRRTRSPRVAQGDVIRDVDYIEHVHERGGILEVSKVRFPAVLVLTQDCDLEQDHTHRKAKASERTSEDKLLFSVLVAPLYNVEHVYTGQHLSELKQRMQQINRGRSPGDNLRRNETPRYHFLDFPATVALPPSVVDFKHYFSVNVAELKRRKSRDFVCQLADLYREDVSQRFSSFLARIGLP